MGIASWIGGIFGSRKQEAAEPADIAPNSKGIQSFAPEEPLTVRIKPCPFCGGTDLAVIKSSIALGGRFDGTWRVVKCLSCGASGPVGETTKNGSALKWNRLARKGSPAKKSWLRKSCASQGCRARLGRTVPRF